MTLKNLPVVVIGAGPVGLAAAAHLAARDLDFVVFEAGDRVAASVRQWSQVRLFSPWRYNLDPAAQWLLEQTGWAAPDPDQLPTGQQLVTDYLTPLAAHPTIAPGLRLGTRVVAVSRTGYDRVRTAGRDTAPFLVRLADGQEQLARAVVDASGTWATPSPLGAAGLAVHGEHEATAYLDPALPDVLGAGRPRFAARHTLVVGAGHSAATTLLALAELAEQAPATTVSWAIRGASPDRVYGTGASDPLSARAALGTHLQSLVDGGRIRLLTGFYTHRLLPDGDGVTVVSRDPSGREQKVTVDRVVAATGYRPDHSIAAELRLDLDPTLGSARALAPLIDPNVHTCGTVPVHGAAELAHPEPDYYTVGVKSYGRAPTFLLSTGYEQVRSVVAAISGDQAAAQEVQLDLPEAGVRSAGLVQLDAPASSCDAPAPSCTDAAAPSCGG